MIRNSNLKQNLSSRAAVVSDKEIAAEAVDAIQWLTTISPETISITVQDGWISLEGTVDWWHQRDTLSELLLKLPGVKGLHNLLTLKVECAAEHAA